jgi:type II secretory pathway pseudopilin PulG
MECGRQTVAGGGQLALKSGPGDGHSPAKRRRGFILVEVVWALALLVPILLLGGESLLRFREKLEDQWQWAQLISLRQAVGDFLHQNADRWRDGDPFVLEIGKDAAGNPIVTWATGPTGATWGARIEPRRGSGVVYCDFFSAHGHWGCLLSTH